MFSVVIPVFNEATCLVEFHRRLAAVLTPLGEWEAIYVNDGSTDDSLDILHQMQVSDPEVAILSLARNFGKEIALTAGLDYSRGDAVIVIDADLQDPPELIETLVKEWLAGYDIVYAQRRFRQGESWLKIATANAFYRVMKNLGRVSLPANTGDFRLMSRRVVTAVTAMREQHRFMKGLFAWVGFPSKAVLYDRAPRFLGSSKWNYWKLWNLALEGITSFTVAPLRVWTYLGLSVAFCAIIYGLWTVLSTLISGNPVPGYPSLMTVVLLLGGVQLITLGVLGEYMGRVFNETKNRPLYFVESFKSSRGSEPASHPSSHSP